MTRGTLPARIASGRRTARDLEAVAVALFLVGAAFGVGAYLNSSGVALWAPAAPLFAQWLPHAGPGTVLAVLIAFAVVVWGPSYAGYLSWRRLLAAGYGVAVAWTFALALIDGWQRGLADRLANPNEYLHEVPGITDIPTMLRTFSSRILDFQPDSWTTHVSGHPPGATLVFVWLDRVGLSGGAWAAVVCVLVGSLVAVAVPVTLWALDRPEAARATVPFAALFPGAVWIGASADGLFAGITASGVALLAVAARGFRAGRGRGGPNGVLSAVAPRGFQAGRGYGGLYGVLPAVVARGFRTGLRSAVPCSLLSGVLLGFGIYLSYGLVLVGLIALAVAFAGRSTARALPLAVLGALAVVAVFTLGGFWWFEGYHLVVERYYQGIATERPYAYWVWANLACLVLCAGPALVAGARRSVVELVGPGRGVFERWRRPDPVLLVVAAAVVVLALADLSGLSKAETERIWLPFTVWLLPAVSLLPVPSRRWWLAGQAATALAVNSLVLTYW
ncbi:hypothetical protein [Amycolatopsis acidicola]|uniref:hypothetical protein n=1 Tax=Amycolatopsis acidicola TaxID=2596893 RepID=UPI001FB7708E|nr:hypothetical protein [Amycolatopsis acidicola]